MKAAKHLKKYARVAASIASLAPNEEYAEGMSNLSAAFRKQAKLLKLNKSKKKRKTK